MIRLFVLLDLGIADFAFATYQSLWNIPVYDSNLVGDHFPAG